MFPILAGGGGEAGGGGRRYHVEAKVTDPQKWCHPGRLGWYHCVDGRDMQDSFSPLALEGEWPLV